MMAIKMVYVVRAYGRMGIQYDTKENILRNEGRTNVESIRPATSEDLSWVRGMGGYAPKEWDALLAENQNLGEVRP